MLLRESTGGRSPFTTKQPFSGRQRNPRRQSKAQRVSSMCFLARLSHLATSNLSLVSTYCAFLTAFLAVVQAPQRVQQKRKSWMMQVTQMMGMNTQVIMRSSSRSQPINQDYQSIQQLAFTGYALYHFFDSYRPLFTKILSISYGFKYQVLSIMSLQSEWDWSTHYKFVTLRGKELLIQKEGLQTWEDLVYAISEQTNFQYNYVKVLINGQRVNYQRKTSLIEVDIPKEAVCLVVKREHFNTDKDKAIYLQQTKALTSKCTQSLDQKYRNPTMQSKTKFVYENYQYQKLLKKLARKYKSLECIRAIYFAQGDEKRAIQYIQSGKASRNKKSSAQKQFEQKKLRQFIKQKKMQEIRRLIQENRVNQMAYRGIMQKIFQLNPSYKELFLKHRKFVKKLFYGRSYIEEPSSQQDQREEQVENQIYLKDYEIQKFHSVMGNKGFTKEDINQALYQSQNNLQKAQYLLENGLISDIQNLPLLVKKQGRINFLLQFFAHPRFEHIRQKLKNNKHKAQSFLQWVSKMNANNQILLILINRYKQEAVALLTGTFVIDKKQKNQENPSVEQLQLTQAEQTELKKKIKNYFNKQMAEQLVTKGFERSVAESIVRAGRSQKEKVLYYEKFQGVHQNFETCKSNRKEEQAFISRKVKSEQGLLLKLIYEPQRYVWLASISETTPFLFSAIIRNFKFFMQLVNQK